MKVAAELFRGIAFVQIHKLPEEQRNVLWDSFDKDRYIKILIDNKIIRNCLQFSEYESWYDKVFIASAAKNARTRPSIRKSRRTEEQSVVK